MIVFFLRPESCWPRSVPSASLQAEAGAWLTDNERRDDCSHSIRPRATPVIVICFLSPPPQDNLINQKMMVMLLRKLGYEILVAIHGRDALDVLEREARRGRNHEIEVILMDASMDVMDGMECTRVIRAQQLPTRIRPFIIAQTANVTEEFQRKCLQSGM